MQPNHNSFDWLRRASIFALRAWLVSSCGIAAAFADEPCPGDWRVNPANSHEYRLTAQYYWGYSDTAERRLPDWLDAEAEAVACGRHLVTINDQREFRAVMGRVHEANYRG